MLKGGVISPGFGEISLESFGAGFQLAEDLFALFRGGVGQQGRRVVRGTVVIYSFY